MFATKKLDVDALVQTELPPLPGAVMRVAALAQDMNTSSRVMAECIGCDPSIATRVLRVANSPLYAAERSFTSLPAAVNAIGNQAIHLLVVVSATSDTFNQKTNRSPLERQLWEHSVTVAIAARELSSALGMRGAEETFLCGLLHDIGKLLLLRHDMRLYAQIAGEADDHKRASLEQEAYGCTHAQIGALAARRWNLPDTVGHVINNHHIPGEAGQAIFTTRAIAVADEMAYAGGVPDDPELKEKFLANESVASLRLNEEQLREVWAKTQAGLKDMAQVLA